MVSQEVKRDALSYVKESVTMLDSQRESLKDRWKRLDRAYRAIYYQSYQAYEGDSAYASPILHDNVEAIVARLCEVLRIGDNSLDIEAFLPSEREKATLYKTIALIQAEQKELDFKKEVFARIGSKYGTAIAKNTWEKETNTIKQRVVDQTVVLDANGEPVLDERGMPEVDIDVRTEETDVVKYIGPSNDIISDLEDIYMDAYIENIQDQPIVVHRLLVDWATIEDGVKAKHYNRDVAAKIKDNPFDSTKISSKAQEVLGLSKETIETENSAKKWEMFEAWCDFDIDNNGKDVPCLITVVNDQLLGIRKNPFWSQQKPFRVWKYREVEGEAYGIGSIEPVLNLFYEYNDTMNQYNDAKAFLLNPVIVEFAGGVSSKQDYNVEPGAVWQEKIQGSLRPFMQSLEPIVTGIGVLGDLETKINNGMGVTPLLQGAGDEANMDKTFLGTQKIIAQADKKFKRIAQRLEKNYWQEWLEAGFKMNAQLLDDLSPFFGVDQEIPWEAQEVVGDFRFDVKGVEHFFDLQDRLNKTMAFAQMNENKPYINSMALDVQIAEMMGIKNMDQVFVEPPEPQPAKKPLNININLDPSKGTAMSMMSAQLIADEGRSVDFNQIVDDMNKLSDMVSPEVAIQSGMLPNAVEEDIIETNRQGDDVTKKVEVVTGKDSGKGTVTKETTETKPPRVPVEPGPGPAPVQ